MLFWRTRGPTHSQLGDSALPLSLPSLVPGRRAWVQHPRPAAGRVGQGRSLLGCSHAGVARGGCLRNDFTAQTQGQQFKHCVFCRCI